MWTIFVCVEKEIRTAKSDHWPLVFFLGVRVAASLKFFIKQWVSGNPPRSPWLKQPTEVVVSCYVDGKNMPSRKAIDEDGFSRCWGGGWADLDIGTLGKGPCQLEIGGRYLYDFFFRLRKSKSFVLFGGGVWSQGCKLKLPNNSTRGVDEISTPILNDFFTGWSFFGTWKTTCAAT